MTSIVSIMMQSYTEQVRHSALENCFASWDDEVSLDIIEQGILERARAINFECTGICIERTGLQSVAIHTPEGTLFEIDNYPALGKITVRQQYGKDLLHPHEEEVLGEWLIKNFHH